MEQFGIQEAVSYTVEDEIVYDYCDADEANSIRTRFEMFIDKGMERIEDRSPECKLIKRTFVMGLGPFPRDASVMAVHKSSISNPAVKAQFDGFRAAEERVAMTCGGDANVRFGWYSASKEEICEILVHGFRDCKKHGDGVQLSHSKFSCCSVLNSEVDENGLRHLLLCRIILGRMDDPSAPKQYLIPQSLMDSHIFPNYVVSFTAASVEGFKRTQEIAIRPSSPWMSFAALRNILLKFLTPPQIYLLDSGFSAYYTGQINRPQLIRRIRLIAGDNLLISVIKKYSNKKSEQTIRDVEDNISCGSD